MQVIGGLVLLVGGGELLVRGAKALALRLGMSPLVIGLTVVAFGTSTPELATSVLAAVRRAPDIAFGNVVGSNLFNVGVVAGACALLRPLVVQRRLPRREIPAVIGLSALCGLLVLDGGLSRLDGAVLIAVFFGAYLWLMRTSLPPAPAEADHRAPLTAWVVAVLVAGGLAMLTAGAHFTVEGALEVGRQFGISEALLGLTVVAAGTSLPELAASSVAAVRGESDIALGNVVGSNLFNIGFILGVTSTVQPMAVTGGLDLLASGMIALVLLPLALTQHTVRRWEGALLVALYLGYILARSGGLV